MSRTLSARKGGGGRHHHWAAHQPARWIRLTGLFSVDADVKFGVPCALGEGRR